MLFELGLAIAYSEKFFLALIFFELSRNLVL
jgi:hypothetical protein